MGGVEPANTQRRGEPRPTELRVGPVQAIKTCLSKSFKFSGRASRSEFWWFVLFIALITLFIPFIAGFMVAFPVGVSAGFEAQQTGAPVEMAELRSNIQAHKSAYINIILALTLLCWWPLFAVIARRLHDTNRKLIMLFSPVLFFVFIFAGSIIYGSANDMDMTKLGQQIGFRFREILFFISLPLFWLLSRPPTAGPNRYGPNPHAVHQ